MKNILFLMLLSVNLFSQEEFNSNNFFAPVKTIEGVEEKTVYVDTKIIISDDNVCIIDRVKGVCADIIAENTQEVKLEEENILLSFRQILTKNGVYSVHYINKDIEEVVYIPNNKGFEVRYGIIRP